MPFLTAILKYAERLRFRQLFFLTAGVFVLDLLIPDLIPFVDELLLGLLTLLFGTWRKTADRPDPDLVTEGEPPSSRLEDKRR